jgi:hypothetical protein
MSTQKINYRNSLRHHFFSFETQRDAVHYRKVASLKPISSNARFPKHQTCFDMIFNCGDTPVAAVTWPGNSKTVALDCSSNKDFNRLIKRRNDLPPLTRRTDFTRRI